MHVRDLVSGDFVRILVKSTTDLIYQYAAPEGYDLVPGLRRKRDRVWPSGLITGGVMSNITETGILKIGVLNQQGRDKIYSATIPYKYIAVLSKGIVEYPEVSTPAFLKGVVLGPRIKYVRVDV